MKREEVLKMMRGYKVRHRARRERTKRGDSGGGGERGIPYRGESLNTRREMGRRSDQLTPNMMRNMGVESCWPLQPSQQPFLS